MPRIFISYRRADTRKDAGRLNDRLVQAFGPQNVFKDVDDIPPGTDFRTVIHDAIRDTDVMLVVIGSRYIEGGRLLQDGDFVRMEVESALARENEGLVVIPVLVDGAQMPTKPDLPPSLHELPYRNAVIIRDDPDFNRDVDRLIAQLQPMDTPRRGSAAKRPPARATQLRPPASPTPNAQARPSGALRRTLVVVALGAMLLTFLGLALLGALLEEPPADDGPPASTQVSAACVGVPPARLVAGARGRVIPGSGNRVREDPTTGARVFTTIPGGALFDVLAGPVCADGYSWWQVRYGNVTGWTAEGTGVAYFVEPWDGGAVGTLAPQTLVAEVPSATAATSSTPQPVTATPGGPTAPPVVVVPVGTLAISINPALLMTQPLVSLDSQVLASLLTATPTPAPFITSQSVRFVAGTIRGRATPGTPSRRDPTLQSSGATLRGTLLSSTPTYAEDTWWWRVSVSLQDTSAGDDDDSTTNTLTAWFRQQDLMQSGR